MGPEPRSEPTGPIGGGAGAPLASERTGGCSINGLILANMDPVRASRSAWATLARIIGPSEPVEVLLEVVEECVRAGHEPPVDAALLDLIDGRPITEHLVLLIVHVRGSGAGPALRSIIEAAPTGGDLLERMRDRVLAASD